MTTYCLKGNDGKCEHCKVPIGDKIRQCPISKQAPEVSPVPNQFKRYSVVWPYLQRAARIDELKYSMRSVQENVSDIRNLVVCGDRPQWFRGDFIASKNRHKGRWSKWEDSVTKLQAMIDSKLVSDTFLWMYDDSFVMKRRA